MNGSAPIATSWISEDLVTDTIETFADVYGCALTKPEAVEILRSVGLLFDHLGESS